MTLRFAALLLIAACLVAGLPAGPLAAQEWAKKMFDTTSHNFGTVARGSKVEHTFTVTNIYQAALAEGVALNPGPEWSTDKSYSRSRMRLCFASPTHEEIREGIARLAEVCRREFGVPTRSANVTRASA